MTVPLIIPLKAPATAPVSAPAAAVATPDVPAVSGPAKTSPQMNPFVGPDLLPIFRARRDMIFRVSRERRKEGMTKRKRGSIAK